MAAQDSNKDASKRQSTLLETFTADLDSMFGLTPEVQELSQHVESRRQEVSSGERELQEIEARLRETERRLARVSRHTSPARVSPGVPSPRTMPNHQQLGQDVPRSSSPLAQGHNFSRPAQPPSYPPPRPPRSGLGDSANMVRGQQFNGSNEYVMVDRSNTGRQEQGIA
ncbi:Hypothetical protein R9X50_00627800 [Acrodontium crateriforme]|uniref:Uncharacterized protein n=1 Tax=Acrodontium crateriforme TaxID=150365 RepID=A0AAQ3M8L5_9PEZI|nr:Hypothetical protein R9X50_00627800 [Acrodontium crateriforme]